MNNYKVTYRNKNDEFEVLFMKNNKVLERNIEYCFEDVLFNVNKYFSEWCSKYNVDTRFDHLEVDLKYVFS